MEIKNFEPIVDFYNENGRNLLSEACKWVSELFTRKVKEKDLSVVTAKQACDILNEIKSGMLFTQECIDKANHKDRVLDIAIDLVDITLGNCSTISYVFGDDFVLF